jgi:creatinine amidohydrolase
MSTSGAELTLFSPLFASLRLCAFALNLSGFGLGLRPCSARSTLRAAMGSVLLEELSWVDAERVLVPEAVVVVPLGAACKEHGPHLKLNNDLVMAQYLERRLRAAADVVVAPTLGYHHYPAFAEYPGSTSLRLSTARDLVVDVCLSLARSSPRGPRRFYVLNTGLSTLLALAPAAQALAAEGVLLRYLDLAAALGPVEREIGEQEGGSHADEIETSMMLYIDPASVDMSRAVKDYDPTGRGALSRARRPDRTYSPTGTWGDPTLATPAKGRRLVEALVAAIVRDVEALRAAPVPC